MIKLSHPQENLFSQNHQSEINPTNHLRPSKLQSNKVELNPIGIAAKTLSQNQNHNLGRMRIRRGQTLEVSIRIVERNKPRWMREREGWSITTMLSCRVLSKIVSF